MSVARLSKGFSFYLKVLLILTFLLPVQGIVVTFAQEDVTDRDLNHIEGSQFSEEEALNLVNIADMGFHIDVATLENTIDTSAFDPPSPDPVGIAYIVHNDSLLISDSEVNEIPSLFEGANLFETSLTGTLVYTATTLPDSEEPTGVAYNPGNMNIFFTDDVVKKVFEMEPGLGGTYDDGLVVDEFSTSPWSLDPSGIGFDSSTGYLYIVDGEGKEVHRVDQNGGDRTSFSISHAGVTDPEGIEYSPACGNLLVADNSNYVVEMTSNGKVIRLIDISAANPVRPSGITLAPESSNPDSVLNLYIADRGIDNNDNPNENDGKVYELSFSDLTDCNEPPEVDAGSDQTIGDFSVQDSILLNATVTDDGKPNPPASVTLSWSQTSGPHPVTFDNASIEDPTVTFPEPGVYVLRLTADDSELAPWDEVTVTVNGPTGVSIESTVNASSDDAEEKTSNNQVTVTSLDLDLVYDSGQSQDQTVGIRFNGIGLPKNATILNAYIQFYARETDAGEVSITIEGQAHDNAPTFTTANKNITNRNTTTASVGWSPGAWVDGDNGFEQRTSDLSPIVQEIVDRGGWSSCNSMVFIFSGSGERVAESFDGWQKNAAILHIYADSGTAPVNQGPCVEAGPDQAIALPAVANLDGTVIDDGLPDPPGVVTSTWSMTSGPGIVTFDDDTAVDTTASFSNPGTYVLRLTAGDSEYSAYDEMTVVVDPQNLPPVVDAGTPQTIALPNSAILDGTVSDDGLPDPPGAYTTTWSKTSGPGAVVFGDASMEDTTASFSTAGTYILRLTAGDGELTAYDEVEITVHPVNQPPVVNAGPDQSVFIWEGAMLDGTVTDDGFPDPPGMVTITWSKIAGPGTVIFGSANSEDTTASFSETGTYVLRLTASDSAFTVSDDVTVTVNPSMLYLPLLMK